MKGRPAESLTGTGAIGALLAIILGAENTEIVAAMVAGLGLLPGLVTLLVSNGGVRGVLRSLWRGRS